ncbi:MAG: bifunctional (p)ppGpp synthetase/guanosine-3',5'-bis(diphosphate) 3'-pyrophosphohydrolase [Deltaproteobacteria bacterium]|nr:bifunctional (p)ppGpp synthetase/guanosine-3',5'-bis(diphosphate) 3'-pyrophosphohydrolase [Deltaproteobacteria bacterium]
MKAADLIEKVRAYNSAGDAELIRQAYDFSARVHKGQKRESGEPYLTHPAAVAGIIAELRLDVPSIVAALLHDTVEDTLTTLEEIEAAFGQEVAALVDGVTKISQINFTSREEKQAENFRKMIFAMARDIRVILIKLADRTHNLRTLNALPAERQQDIAQETLDIYAPLAHRLGIYWIKSELEDSALRYLRPEVYYQLKRNVAKKKAARERYIKEVIDVLRKRLETAGISAELSGRPKHFYSIYQKMQSQNLLYDQIYDLVAFRVIVDTVRECYEALGVVHAAWKPVPGRFKDYIGLPKANGYQSLHTTVIGPYGERMEVQIRTHEMHRVAESGIAAHWRYKGPGTPAEETQRFAWLRQLLEWQQNLSDPQDFLRSVKDDLFSDEVFVFTPRGDLFNFPEGASVIDFAFRIHSEVGNHCAGARVNSRLVPLRYRLHNGDTVEIITTATQTPSSDWLNFVKTSRAKARIRSWIKYQQRARSIAVGREILERDLARYDLDLGKLRKDGKLAAAVSGLSVRDEDTLLAAVGYGKITAHQVMVYVVPPEQLKAAAAAHEESALKRLFRMVRRQAPGGVRVSGVEDMLVRFGKCCDPLPGERILGFITRGRGVTVHTIDCPRVLESDPQRRVEVVWEDGAQKALRPVTVEVTCVDEPGLLAAMSKAISGTGVNISRAQVKSEPDKHALNSFEVMVGDANQLNRVIRALSKVRGVTRVARARG